MSKEEHKCETFQELPCLDELGRPIHPCHWAPKNKLAKLFRQLAGRMEPRGRGWWIMAAVARSDPATYAQAVVALTAAIEISDKHQYHWVEPLMPKDEVKKDEPSEPRPTGRKAR